MSDTQAAVMQAKPEQPSDEMIAVLIFDEANEHTESKKAVATPEVGSKTDNIAGDIENTKHEPAVKTGAAPDIKLESVEDADANDSLPIIIQIPNPRFSRADSTHMKEEDCEDDEVQILTNPPPKRSRQGSDRVLSDKLKNVRTRARKAARDRELAVVGGKYKTKLAKAAGVVIDCSLMAKDSCAVVSLSWSDSRLQMAD